VKHGRVNASIPKAESAESVTLERAVELLAARAAKGGKGKKASTKKAPAKKAGAKKAGAKKSAAKKPAKAGGARANAVPATTDA
jgi:DNA topoisomerase-1